MYTLYCRFGLDFMVDEEYKVWNLECNISPDLSKGTDVLVQT